MWFIFAIISGCFYTASNLLIRHVLKGNKDAWAFSFFYSAVGALVSIPFMLFEPKFPTTVFPWIIMIVVGFFIVLQNYLILKSSNYIAASVTGTISKFRLVWIFLLGLILLHESYSPLKLIGTLLTVSSGIIFLYKASTLDKRGVLYAFSATFFYATVILLYKFLFSSFNSQTLTVFIFLFPALINLMLMPDAGNRIRSLFIHYRTPVLLACTLGGFAGLTMNYALSIGEATKTLVIIEAFLMLTLVLEQFLLKEKGSVVKKVIATLLAVAGAILIRVS